VLHYNNLQWPCHDDTADAGTTSCTVTAAPPPPPGPALANWRPCSQWCVASRLGDLGSVVSSLSRVRGRVLTHSRHTVFQGLRNNALI